MKYLAYRTTLLALYVMAFFLAYVFEPLMEGGAIPILVFAVVCVLILTSMVFRCRALNWSSWRLLFLVVPIAGELLTILLLVLPEKRQESLVSDTTQYA